MNDTLDTSNWQRLGALFEQALGLGPAEQAELLHAIEREDVDLARTLASMLEADARHRARTSELSERALRDFLDAVDSPELAFGDRVGPYILRESLGWGGMGEVYRAERVDGQVRQEVAIKIVKRAYLDASGRERFLREREIVASFQHPYIARMLDVGQTPGGSPYLAMELIRGLPITAWCDARKLDTRGRIEVFLHVCEAVQHAHANLVLHRDIKPSNVLVGDDRLPKLIDFGIAKPLTMRVDDEHQQTATARGFFSPSNAAPEQLRGERVGVACDVYQLGTLLHELLCGSTVFDAMGLTHGQLEHLILEVPPEAPSARAVRTSEATAQAHGAATPAALARELRGELDWIAMKALEKEPGRRYQSALDFAADLRRFLAGDAVQAAPPAFGYRLRKVVARNKGAVAAGVVIAIALLVAMAEFAWQARVAREEERLAKQHANELERVSNYQEAILRQIDTTKAGTRLSQDVQARFAMALAREGVREPERSKQVDAFAAQWRRINATDTVTKLIDHTFLEPAVAEIDRRFKDLPAVDASLRQTLADRYVEMGLYDEALPLQRSALATRRRVLGDRNLLTVSSIVSMGNLLDFQEKLDVAEPYFREAVATSRRQFGEDDDDTLEAISYLGQLLRERGKFGESERLTREVLEKRRRRLGEDHEVTLVSLSDLANLLVDEGKLAEAEPYLREVMAKFRRVRGEGDIDMLRSINNLGTVLAREGKQKEAEPLLREVLDKRRRLLGEEHPDTLLSLQSLGGMLLDEGLLGEAEPYLREEVEKSRRVLGDDNLDTVTGVSQLGRLLVKQGRHAEAEMLLAPSEAAARKAFGDAAPAKLAYFLMSLGKARAGQHKFNLAQSNLIESYSIYLKNSSARDNRTASATRAIVDSYTQWNIAEPGKGYDAKATEWNRKLEASGKAGVAAQLQKQ